MTVDDRPIAVAPAPPRAPEQAPPQPRPAPAPAAPPQPQAQGGWGLPLVVLIAGMFMSILDVSIVNVAIPTIQNDFGATTDQVEWVATAYTLALGVVVPVSAWLAERVGMKRVYNAALVAFAAGSALCGIAWSLDSLIFFRIIQAIPGGVLPVVTLSMVMRIVPKDKIGQAMGMYGLGIVVAPAIGPTLGGYLVEYVDWRLIFFINVPVGILGAAAALFVLPNFPGARKGRFDWLGFFTVAGGLFALLLALSEGQSWGWSSYRIIILLAAAALLLALFVVVELEVETPLLDVRVFKFWPYTNSLLLISVLMIGLFGVLFFIPLFLQQAQGLGAFDAGLLLLPQALVMAVMMPLAGRVYDKIGPRWPAVIGLSIVAIGTYQLRNLTLDSSHGYVAGVLALRACGMGMAMMPIMTGGVSAVPPRYVGTASAFNNLVQRSASALGLAILTAYLTMWRSSLGDGRAALVGADGVPMPQLAPGPTGQMMGTMMVYQQTQTQAFVSALDELMVVTTVTTLVGVGLAFFLRNGPAPKTGGPGPAMME